MSDEKINRTIRAYNETKGDDDPVVSVDSSGEALTDDDHSALVSILDDIVRSSDSSASLINVRDDNNGNGAGRETNYNTPMNLQSAARARRHIRNSSARNATTPRRNTRTHSSSQLPSATSLPTTPRRPGSPSEFDRLLPRPALTLQSALPHRADIAESKLPSPTQLAPVTVQRPSSPTPRLLSNAPPLTSTPPARIPPAIRRRPSPSSSSESSEDRERDDFAYLFRAGQQARVVSNDNSTSLNGDIHGSDVKSELILLTCLICREQQAATVLFPCMHINMCISCANAFRKNSNVCPSCRLGINTIARVFLSDSRQDTTPSITPNDTLDTNASEPSLEPPSKKPKTEL